MECAVPGPVDRDSAIPLRQVRAVGAMPRVRKFQLCQNRSARQDQLRCPNPGIGHHA